jgi:hypothetical protein
MKQQLLNPSHHKTAFHSVLNRDIVEGEVDVEHGTDDNIDEPCASQ